MKVMASAVINCCNTIQCVHVAPKYYYVRQTMLERQCCNTVFPQNKCLDAYFKFQLKGLEYIIEGGWVVILLQIIMVVIL